MGFDLLKNQDGQKVKKSFGFFIFYFLHLLLQCSHCFYPNNVGFQIIIVGFFFFFENNFLVFNSEFVQKIINFNFERKILLTFCMIGKIENFYTLKLPHIYIYIYKIKSFARSGDLFEPLGWMWSNPCIRQNYINLRLICLSM